MNKPSSFSSALELTEDVGGLPCVLLLQKARQQGGEVMGACETLLALILAGKGLRNDLRRHFDTIGLNEMRLGILNVLSVADSNRLTPAFLSDQVKISRSAMTEALDSLETRGWIRRERCREDRRQIFVEITPAGRRVSEQGIELFLKLARQIVSGMGESSSRQLIESCDRLVKSSHQQSPPPFSSATPSFKP